MDALVPRQGANEADAQSVADLTRLRALEPRKPEVGNLELVARHAESDEVLRQSRRRRDEEVDLVEEPTGRREPRLDLGGRDLRARRLADGAFDASGEGGKAPQERSSDRGGRPERRRVAGDARERH